MVLPFVIQDLSLHACKRNQLGDRPRPRPQRPWLDVQQLILLVNYTVPSLDVLIR